MLVCCLREGEVEDEDEGVGKWRVQMVIGREEEEAYLDGLHFGLIEVCLVD
jgi:hypothetical protein